MDNNSLHNFFTEHIVYRAIKFSSLSHVVLLSILVFVQCSLHNQYIEIYICSVLDQQQHEEVSMFCGLFTSRLLHCWRMTLDSSIIMNMCMY